MRKKLRPLGKITLDMEKLLSEMCIDHDLQWGEVLSLVHGYMVIHLPDSQEQYVKGGSPVFHYGPKSETKNK